MTRPVNLALALCLIGSAPLTAAADSQHSQSSEVRRPLGVHVPPRPSAQTAMVCTGHSVTVIVIDPKTGKREKRCKCAPGAVGIATKNTQTGAVALRCLQPAGPRP